MKQIHLIRYGLGLVLLWLLTQCRNVNPQPPKSEGFDAPLTPIDSYVAGPLIFQLKQLEDKINQELDPVLVGKGAPGGKRGSVFPFRVARSGRVHVQYVDQQIRFSTPLQLWIVKPFSKDKTPPERPFCSLDVRFQSPLSVTPNWRLTSQVKFVDYEWIIKPQIRLLGKEISLTGLAQQLLNEYQPAIESAIDAAIHNELRLDQLVSPIWRGIQKPLLIDKQYGLWLMPKPVAVEASPISGDTQTIVSHLRITLKTSTALNPQEPVYSPTALPSLQKRDELPQVSDLHLMSAIPYSDINRMLDQTVNGQPKKLALGTLTVKKVSVYGGQRSLIVRADVGGLLNGTVYLRGRPEFDTLTSSLVVKNLDLDIGTIDAVPQWTRSMFRKGLITMLESALTLPLADEIARFPHKINTAFAKGKAGERTTLTMQGFRFMPRQIAIRPNELQTMIHVQAKVALRVKKL